MNKPKSRKPRDIIQQNELETMSVDELASMYVRGSNSGTFDVWFEDLMPKELEVIFPTTDSKLNYLSFSSRLASAVAYSSREVCQHTGALDRRRERFASVINKFLDLHQILRES
ncbi:DNA packaging protein UL33 [Spheniscid alphaherpesvirus 1]|uniref:DNA packaging protein UL33 n=1 Tax=Spheniscid alphaherpesvirus 1 TaxID=2560777 RepID=A0A1R3T896_9ALPH|nr:DNA packaging protein UL33 [Spheniscid alphaherpesvirus 1]SCO83537.1 DNA packaging protein UL33 [Spheniscid alphaherpesvirus 1]